MKPLKLTLRGINSYRTEQIIDFEKLTASGLFGIFGPTGSGKSSILDAITLALYAKLPRSTKNFININEKTAAISFLFSITTTETHRYQVERSFRYHGEKESATVRNVSGRLLDVTGDSPVVLADRPTEVTQECVRLLGLTSDDFMRTVVLPQGQFSEFLKLKNSDRRNMLQRIFHLEKYGLELTQKIASARQQQDLLLSNLEGQLNIFEEITPEKLRHLTKQLDTVSKENEALSNEVKKAESSFKAAEELYNLINEYEPLKKSFDSSMKELPSIKEQEKQLEINKRANSVQPFDEQAKKAFQSHQKAVKRFQEAQHSLTEFLSNFTQLENDRDQIQKEYAEKLPFFVSEEAKLQSAINQMATVNIWLRKLETLKKTLDEQTILLENSRKNQAELLETGNRYRQEILRLETQTEALQTPPEQLHALEKGHALEETYREKRRSYEKNLERFSEKQKQQTQEQKVLEQLCIRLHRLSHQAVSLKENFNKVLRETSERQQHIKEERKKVTRQMEELQTQNMASVLRNQLMEGKPCPVCGALHHDSRTLNEHIETETPGYEAIFQMKQEHLDKLEEEEKNILLEQKQLERQISVLETSLQLIPPFSEEFFCPDLVTEQNSDSFQEECTAAELNQMIQETVSQYSSAKGSFLQRTTASLEEERHLKEDYALLQSSGQHILSLRNQWQIDNFTTALTEKQKQEEELKKLQNIIKKFRLDMEKNEQENQSVSENILNLSQKISSIKSDIFNHETFIKEQKNKLPDDFPENMNYENLLSRVQKEKKLLEEKKQYLEEKYKRDSSTLLQKKEEVSAAESLEKSCKAFKLEAEKRLQSELIKQHFSLDTVLESFYLPEEEIEKKAQELENFQNNLRQTSERLQYLDNKRNERWITQEEWEKCKERYLEIQNLYEEKKQEEILLKHQVENCQTQLLQKEKLLTEQSASIHKRGLIRQLEQLFKGNAFVEYVAQSRLKYIAAEASDILGSISNGNYALEVNEVTEFIIRDNKNGGILRPCDTLSGGETFITSLALALALSSVIQLNGTAPLELFFLDEGFGSLDDDLLDVVMTSLERLQNKRRSIGIITHVEAIQARVPVKLVVTPSDISQNGSSIRLEYS